MLCPSVSLLERSNCTSYSINSVSEANIKILFNSSVVVNNLYPFEDTISKDGVSVSDAVEQIDIGRCEVIKFK